MLLQHDFQGGLPAVWIIGNPYLRVKRPAESRGVWMRSVYRAFEVVRILVHDCRPCDGVVDIMILLLSFK